MKIIKTYSTEIHIKSSKHSKATTINHWDKTSDIKFFYQKNQITFKLNCGIVIYWNILHKLLHVNLSEKVQIKHFFGF